MTEEIKTPRTDALLDGSSIISLAEGGYSRDPRDLCRRLEIELAQVTAELEKAREALSKSCDEQRGEYYPCQRAEAAESELQKARERITFLEKDQIELEKIQMRLEDRAEAAEAKNAELVAQITELQKLHSNMEIESFHTRIKELEAKLQEQKQMVDIQTKRAEMAEFLVTETLMALQEKETIRQGAK